MKKILLILSAFIFLSGCATPVDMAKSFFGISTKELEERRKDALVKVFDYDYETCYAKTEKILNGMKKVSIYAKDKDKIALFYIDPYNTPVGVFFVEMDQAHTRVEISSPSSAARGWVAKNVFSERILPPTPEARIKKQQAEMRALK